MKKQKHGFTLAGTPCPENPPMVARVFHDNHDKPSLEFLSSPLPLLWRGCRAATGEGFTKKFFSLPGRDRSTSPRGSGYRAEAVAATNIVKLSARLGWWHESRHMPDSQDRMSTKLTGEGFTKKFFSLHRRDG